MTWKKKKTDHTSLLSIACGPDSIKNEKAQMLHPRDTGCSGKVVQ